MQHSPNNTGAYRIGDLARRVGINEHLLRAWERRYQVVTPARSAGGYRLYSTDDERRLRLMARLVGQGRAPGEAARIVLSGATPSGPAPRLDPATSRLVTASLRRLRTALRSMAEPRAQAVLDEVLAVMPLEVAIRRVLLQVLRELGDGWQDAQETIAREHFATAVIRGRLAALARGWGQRSGPRALLACPPEERHDLVLHLFGLLLARRGWSVSFLGADTPIAAVAAAVAAQRIDVVVLSITDPARLVAVIDDLRELSGRVRVALAGPGINDAMAARVGAEALSGDPVSAADTLSEDIRPEQSRRPDR